MCTLAMLRKIWRVIWQKGHWNWQIVGKVGFQHKTITWISFPGALPCKGDNCLFFRVREIGLWNGWVGRCWMSVGLYLFDMLISLVNVCKVRQPSKTSIHPWHCLYYKYIFMFLWPTFNLLSKNYFINSNSTLLAKTTLFLSTREKN